MNAFRPEDGEYPERLRTLQRPPDPLYVSGRLPHSSLPTVGVVGTRRLTPYGSRIARELAGAFAASGAVIVSGLAQGIDSTAHAAAVEAGGQTIAVLGEGLAAFDTYGPIARRKLAAQIRKQGAVVSEYAMDIAPADWTFPRRNRTIAALSDVLVVIEAPDGSGALITARHAIDLGRPVYAVPGPLGAPTWVGSNRLIAARKATILTDANEVAQVVRLELPTPQPLRDLSLLGEKLIGLLAGDAMDADSISTALGLASMDSATLIAELLIAGRIVATGDGRFARA